MRLRQGPDRGILIKVFRLKTGGVGVLDIFIGGRMAWRGRKARELFKLYTKSVTRRTASNLPEDLHTCRPLSAYASHLASPTEGLFQGSHTNLKPRNKGFQEPQFPAWQMVNLPAREQAAEPLRSACKLGVACLQVQGRFQTNSSNLFSKPARPEPQTVSLYISEL